MKYAAQTANTKLLVLLLYDQRKKFSPSSPEKQKPVKGLPVKMRVSFLEFYETRFLV